jgi:hypothetical protein
MTGQIRFRYAYAGGITPSDSTMSSRIEDVETEGVLHGSVEANYYITFWSVRWQIDNAIFWEGRFFDVLHFMCARQV